ncbi:glycoside hydrolase family 3 C-terminal domain-containing protein [Micromonospora endophytica]|uniref:Exo-alpha-(1->6)-L-arabinopyranosidase n=1 Tax=Micromonospora endophytica TaxID=515350 RepID=A0A2W2CW97_9ACTN|nr:glycoside hydrolase family 3 C-terminal domain-containing protein [Micromonospora endophytica]PZF97584.1 beta-glucosidase [Micromonospora endophytica]RIW49529.1 beta-glucosidase [Micromonospora endophytica]BCJ62583.1 sugar hydrolase [Micromonospora endophytica]
MTDRTTPHPRVEDLLARLTLPEKIGLLHQWQAAVPRLDLPGFRTGTEALHGVAWLGEATVFPQVIGLASSWNPDLLRAIGAAVGDEVRAKHHADPDRVGLNVWAPVVNPLRDPRWGRNEEGWSEDPWLTGRLATAYAHGLRGDHPERLRTAPTVKHFLGYNNETDRATTSSDLPPRVLHEYELPAFRAPLAAGAAVAAMASYNLVNGVPAHLSPLIDAELRRWAPGEVLVVGDAEAVSNIAGVQGHRPDHVSGFAAALRAGIDSFTENGTDSEPTRQRLTEALRRGLISTADVDRAVRRILTLRLRLGDLDPPHTDPYAATGPQVVDCPAHRELARKAARQSVVLLHHTGLLPLPSQSRVAVLGPLADVVYEDWYSGTLPYAVTTYQGLAERLPQVTTHPGADRIRLRLADRYVGCPDDDAGGPLTVGAEATDFDVYDWGRDTVALRAVGNGRHVGADDDGVLVNDRPGPGGWVVRETFQFDPLPDGAVLLRHLATDRYVTVDTDGRLRVDGDGPQAATAFTIDLVADGVAEAAALAAAADVAVVALGNHPMVGGRETEDRVDLALPARQEALLRAVHAANPRTVLVLTSSYPYAIGWAREHLPAVLWSAHGGQEHGTALAEVLLGDAEPGGRLTQTWYADDAELPDLFDYDVIGADATYLYYRGDPLFPFGHGLSYTDFAYSGLRLSASTVTVGAQVEVSVEVTNTGARTGEEVVQLYTRQRRSRVKQPLRQLRDFARVTLAPGERQTVTLRLRTAELTWWDADRGGYVVEDATHSVLVGRSATDVRQVGAVTVRGEPVERASRLHTASGAR